MQPALLRLAAHDQTRAVRQVEGDPPGPIGPVLELEAADGAEREARDHRLGTEGQSKRVRCVMIVALARKLAIALWRYVETGLIPEGAVVK